MTLAIGTAEGDFLHDHLPAAPARLLEIGCGDGELALSLAAAGYDVTAIDPEAPDDAIFRRVALEAFTEPGPFDVVLARVSLHHIEDLRQTVDTVAGLLAPGGVLLMIEFARDHLTGATARWYYHLRQALAASGREDSVVPSTFEQWLEEATRHLADLHDVGAIKEALAERFVEIASSWGPYLHSWRLHPAVEPLERALIESGAIQATGYFYAGRLR